MRAMRRHRIMGVIAALAWLTAVGCRRQPPPPAPFSRASVIGQLASSYANVSLPSDELPPNVLAYEELVYAHTPAGDLALDLYLPSLPEVPGASAAARAGRDRRARRRMGARRPAHGASVRQAAGRARDRGGDGQLSPGRGRALPECAVRSRERGALAAREREALLHRRREDRRGRRLGGRAAGGAAGRERGRAGAGGRKRAG